MRYGRGGRPSAARPSPARSAAPTTLPLFPSVTVTRPSCTLQINGTGAGPSNQYVQGFNRNGVASTRTWLRYGGISGNATLNFTMGSSPSTWGTNAADVPPSYNDGSTSPSAAPDLGTNLALGKAATASTPCNADEAAAKAFDVSLSGKWCSLASGTKFLQVDLGSAQNVGSFVLKHAGLGGESTGYNTGAYNVQTSVDGTNWTTVVNVSSVRSSRSHHTTTQRQARYVRLNVTTPANNGNTAARIYEFEVYPG